MSVGLPPSTSKREPPQSSTSIASAQPQVASPEAAEQQAAKAMTPVQTMKMPELPTANAQLGQTKKPVPMTAAQDAAMAQDKIVRPALEKLAALSKPMLEGARNGELPSLAQRDELRAKLDGTIHMLKPRVPAQMTETLVALSKHAAGEGTAASAKEHLGAVSKDPADFVGSSLHKLGKAADLVRQLDQVGETSAVDILDALIQLGIIPYSAKDQWAAIASKIDKERLKTINHQRSEEI